MKTNKMFIIERIKKMVEQMDSSVHVDVIVKYSANACNLMRSKGEDVMLLLSVLPRGIERQVLHKIR